MGFSSITIIGILDRPALEREAADEATGP